MLARKKMHLFYVYRTNSTQDHAKALVELHFDCVSFWVQSAMQMHGRGQRGRKWESEPGNLYLTGCFEKQNIAPGQLSIATGVLLANILKTLLEKAGEAAELEVGLKWPNDLLVNGKKCGGVLIEMSEHIYVGIGINVHNHPENGPNMNMPAAHLPTVNRECLAGEIMQNMDVQFFKLQNFETVQEQWWGFAKDWVGDWHLREPITGEVVGVDSLGQLLIRNSHGEISARHQTFV